MLKLLQGILANKITTEDVTTSGAPRMRGQLTCGTDCNGKMCGCLPDWCCCAV